MMMRRGMGDCYPVDFSGPLPDGSTYCPIDPENTNNPVGPNAAPGVRINPLTGLPASSTNWAMWIAAGLGLVLFIPLLTGGRR